MVENGAPYMYDYRNAVISSVEPSTVHARDTVITWYWRRWLLQKAMSLFNWKLPDNWDKDYFLYTLYCWGYVAIVKTDKYGVIPQSCTLGGLNVFYRPTWALISNPLLKGILRPVIGEQCTLFKLRPDYAGIMDVTNHYAELTEHLRVFCLCRLNDIGRHKTHRAGDCASAAADTVFFGFKNGIVV